MEYTVTDDGIKDTFKEELVQEFPSDCDRHDIISIKDNDPINLLDDLVAENSENKEDFSDIAQYGIIYIVGDDAVGHKIIGISASSLPNREDIDHSKILRYLIYTLNNDVKNDYRLIYFHYGLTSKNRPSVMWLWQAYRALNRESKKKLKALYLVHPTFFIKLVWKIFKAVISSKFSKKIVYVYHLQELRQYLDMSLYALQIPKPVLEHDEQLMKKIKNVYMKDGQMFIPLATQQFGVSLQFIKSNNGGKTIPPFVQSCVKYLSLPNALETEGLFRRCTNLNHVKDLQDRVNHGEPADFGNDVHLAAVSLKIFFRDLVEPLMTFGLFNEIKQFQGILKSRKLQKAKYLILKKLPIDNYHLLKYLVNFLTKVIEKSDLNRMNSYNLGVVFGPNLIRNVDNQVSLTAIGPINEFTKYLLENHEQIFIK